MTALSSMLGDMLMKNCLVLAAIVAGCIVIGLLIGNAVKARRLAEQEAQELLKKKTDDIEAVASDLSDQSAKLQRGFKRISESRDPLQAFIDALSERKDVVNHNRRSRGRS